MSLEVNKVIVQRMFEAINTKNLVSLEELMSPDFVMYMNSKETKGWNANRRFIEEEFNAFPDLRVNIEDILAEGNLVSVRVIETATHTNEYRGIAPTGNKLNYVVMMIWRIIDGKIVEGWVVYDQLGFLQQLGVPFNTDLT
jgi:steroid delta-isomerase-like uncharacterized protein